MSISADETNNVANFDVAGIADMWQRFTSELIGSQSSPTNEFNDHDRGRAQAYCDRIVAYIGLVAPDNETNPLDLPQTHPSTYPYQPFSNDDDIAGIENLIMKQVVRQMKAGHTEITKSQSADRASGLGPGDKTRQLALVANIKAMIEFGADTIDMPENPGNIPAV